MAQPRRPGPADQSLASGGSPCPTLLAQFPRIFFIILGISLSGCSTFSDALRPCVAADVVTTVAGVRSGLMTEGNPLWKASVNAGHFAPFVLASIGLVWLVEWWDDPRATKVVSGVECGMAARNLWIMR